MGKVPMPGVLKSDDAHISSSAGAELPRLAEVLRLANRLHGLPHDPAARKRALLDGLIKLASARAGVCIVAHDDGETPVLLSTAHVGANAARAGARRTSAP